MLLECMFFERNGKQANFLKKKAFSVGPRAINVKLVKKNGKMKLGILAGPAHNIYHVSACKHSSIPTQ